MFSDDIAHIVEENTNFRKVLCTGPNSQLVAMCIPVGSDIGEETHPHTDQILCIVEGNGIAELNHETFPIAKNNVTVVPAGTLHNFKNTGDTELKLYTVYAPPAHKDGTIHATKADAAEEEAYEQG